MRNALIQKIVSDQNFKKICKVLNHSYAEDIMQEVCLKILEMPEDRLPRMDGLNFWFYCIVRNMSSKTGTFGKLVLKNEFELICIDDQDEPEHKQRMPYYISDIKEEVEEIKYDEQINRRAELFMLELSEFENRVVLLYNEHGNMKKVAKITGISYSALRAVKNKLKTFK
jgi:RNA polymerase sigma factor (sigma-70 family)